METIKDTADNNNIIAEKISITKIYFSSGASH